MKKLLLAAGLTVATIGAAEACTIEDWNWSEYLPDTVEVNLVMTCPEGKLIARFYDENDEFIGTGTDYFDGYVAHMFVHPLSRIPSSLGVKYVVN